MTRFATIIITSYNYARFLNECIDSALQQTYENTEVIVIDDGSVDESPDVIRSYGTRIHSLIKPNGGQASSFNLGFTICKGDAICFLDSDDVLEPTAMEKVMVAFEQPDVSMVHWPLSIVDTRGTRTGRLIPKKPLAEGDIRNALIRKGPHCYTWAPTSGSAWSRKFLTQVLPMSEKDYWTFCDSYLTTLSPLYGLIKKVDEPLTRYRSHGGGIHTKITLEQTLAVSERDCQVLQNELTKLGIEASPNNWDLTIWRNQIKSCIDEIKALIPTGEKLILVDQDNWGTQGSIAGRTTLPFPRHNGFYGGPPANDGIAIASLEELRGEGANFIVFVPQGLWWLDHYKEFSTHLRSKFTCARQTEQIAIFDLREQLQ